MNNFKKPKKASRSGGSMDGMLPKPQAHPAGFAKSYQPSGTVRSQKVVGDFRRRNGFHANSAGSIASRGATQNSGLLGGQDDNVTHINEIDLAPSEKERKGRRFLRRPGKKFFKRLAILLVLAVLGVGIYFGVKLYFTGKNIFQGGSSAPALAKTVDASKLNGEGDGRINILLIGKGGDGHEAGDLTDTLLVASIDPVQKETALLSIPRDLYVKIPNNGYSKINAAYEYGKQQSKSKDKNQQEADGIKLLFDTLSPVIGIPLHYYVMVDFTAYKKVVDTVGGIDITLDEAIWDPNFDWQYGRNALKLPKGKVHLNGTQALLLGRARGAAGGYGVGTDFDRNENQRKMLIALKEKIMSAGTYSNPVKVNEILTALGDHVRTSFSSLNELKRLYEIESQVSSDKIYSYDLVTPPHNYLTTSTINGLSVILPRAGQGNYKEIQNFVRNSLKDSFLKQESAILAIYNGTNTAGAAGTKATDLRSYGYIVNTVADAPTKTYQKTVLVDLTNGSKKYTKRYLEQRLHTTAVSSIPDPKIKATGADFVIIIGSDEATTQ